MSAPLLINEEGQAGRLHACWQILVQPRRARKAAKRFFRKMLKGQGRVPRRLVTDKLRSYPAALRSVMPSVIHSTKQYENNRVEVSHQPTRQRERQMRKFKSPGQAQRFLSCQCMDSSKTSSASGATCCRLAITESYGVARSSLGTSSRAPRDSNGDVTPAAPGLLAQRQLDCTRVTRGRTANDLWRHGIKH